MKKIQITAVTFAAVVLAVLGGVALAQQEKYTLKVPGGLAFSEFRGFEDWATVAVSQSGDLIEVIVRMMDSEAGFTGPVNIGNPVEHTMLQLAERVIQLVGGHSKLVFRPLPSDDPRQRQPDISLAKEKLGWEPRVSLDDGLRETIAYFRKLLKGEVAA